MSGDLGSAGVLEPPVALEGLEGLTLTTTEKDLASRGFRPGKLYADAHATPQQIMVFEHQGYGIVYMNHNQAFSLATMYRAEERYRFAPDTPIEQLHAQGMVPESELARMGFKKMDIINPKTGALLAEYQILFENDMGAVFKRFPGQEQYTLHVVFKEIDGKLKEIFHFTDSQN